jgi:hypothetical protein
MRHGQHLRRQGLQRAGDIECQLLLVRINTAQQPHAAGTAAGIVQAGGIVHLSPQGHHALLALQGLEHLQQSTRAVQAEYDESIMAGTALA